MGIKGTSAGYMLEIADTVCRYVVWQLESFLAGCLSVEVKMHCFRRNEYLASKLCQMLL